MNDEILPITMPKWGLTMTHGTLLDWLVEEGEDVAVGDEVVDVDTEKATQGVESQVAGTLRRKIATPGDSIDVGGVLGVVAPRHVSDAAIDAFVTGLAATTAGEAVSAGPTSETVDGPLGPVHLLTQGEGPETVVLLHGFGGDAQNWRFALEPLAASRTVVAVDLPGHGNSAKNVGDGAIPGFVDTVIAVLDARGVAAAHLVGHSFGGLVATQVALAHPDRVSSLTLVAPAGLGGSVNASFVDGFVDADSRQQVKAVLSTLFAPGFQVNRQLVEEVLRYKRIEGVQEALATLRDHTFPDGRQAIETWQSLEDIAARILVVWGQDDQVIEAGHIANAPGSATIELLEGVGHSPHIEAAGRFNRIVADFLDG